MLQAFVDDTIGPSGQRQIYLAAYVHTAEMWAAFSDAWDAELKAEPAIDYFKMVEAQNRRDQFKGFSEAKRTKKVFALARVIQRFRPWAVHARLSHLRFDELVKPFAPHPLATPYHPLFFAIIFGVARVHNYLGLNVPCDFVLDQQDGLPRKVLPFLDTAKEALPEEVRKLIGNTPIFRDDRDFLPLQAADLLAWHTRRFHEENYPSEYEGLVKLLSFDGGHFAFEITDENLAEWGTGFQSVPGAQALGDKRAYQRMVAAISDEDREKYFGGYK